MDAVLVEYRGALVGLKLTGSGRSRNRSALNAKLKGSTLGDTNRDDSLSTKDWAKKLAKRAKQREKELAERRQRDMEEADKAAYDERDLAGLKVRHGAEQFEEGEDVILTLRDSRVLEGEGVSCFVLWAKEDADADSLTEDELQNVNMVDEEAIKAAKERKRKAQEQYTGYDDEEFEEGRIGQKADILGKYDDEFSTGKVKSEVSIHDGDRGRGAELIITGFPTRRANREENDHHRRGHGNDWSSPGNQGEIEPGLRKYVEPPINPH